MRPVHLLRSSVAFCSLAFVSLTLAQAPPRDPFAEDNNDPQPPAEQAAGAAAVRINNADDEALRRKLNESAALDFVDSPLTTVAQHLREKHGIKVQLDARALEDAGLATDTPVSMSLEDVPLRTALELMFRQLDLAAITWEGILLITTRDKADMILETRVYDVRDLIVRDVGGLVAEHPETDYDSLVQMITTTVAPTSWDDVGGPGSITPAYGTLVVSQTQAVHGEIEKLLATLRKILATPSRHPLADHAARPIDPDALSVKLYRIYAPRAAAGGGFPGPAEQTPGPGQLNTFGSAGSAASPPAASSQYMQDLAKAIPAMIDPPTWDTAGGQGTIRAIRSNEDQLTGVLLVRQTPAVHADIERLLKQLQVRGFEGGGMGGGFF